MIKNYLLIAIRSLQRQFTYSLINVFGLAIGLACSAVIFMYVWGEWSYDRHYANADRIYRVGISFFNMDGFADGPEVLGESLPAQYEGVESFTRVSRAPSLLISNGTQEFKELAYYTDTAFFHIFSYEFVQGNASLALKDQHNLVLTEHMAKVFFGDNDALGKTLLIGKEKKPFTVSAIVRDDNRNSQLKAKIWLSNQGELKHERLWTSASHYNYVLLKEGKQQKDLEAALDRLMEKEIYTNPMGVPSGLSFEDYKKHPNAVHFYVHAFKDVHLKSKLKYELSPGGDEASMYTFGAISLFILLLAAVNFINLTTARASRRAKEVGIRKVIGSSRRKLVAQFLTESLMVSVIAMVLALFLGEAFLYLFELMAGNKLIPSLWSAWNLGILFFLALSVGVLSGIYPAFYLTAFKPVRVLKGNWAVSGGSFFRNALVVSQFTISICLMMCAAVIIRQMDFMKTKDLGFNQENIITIDNMAKLGTHTEAFRDYLARLAGVTNTSFHTGEPGNGSISTFTGFQSKVMEQSTAINTYLADDQLLPLMDFHLIEGRNFDKALASDTAGAIINEAAAKVFGLEKPLGADLGNGGYRVIGIVKDFHWESLRQSISPTVFLIDRKKDYMQLSVRFASGRAQEIVDAATVKWKELVPDDPMRYHFLDANFGEMLEKERLFGKAVSFFTLLAIFISCLGLYGLSAYTTEQRNKEIGIRKVLGANASSIVLMLNRKFVTLVALSVVIATPLAVYFMSRWMEGFAYHTEMEIWLFVAAILGALAVALATVSYHSIRASMTNPVDTLKYE